MKRHFGVDFGLKLKYISRKYKSSFSPIDNDKKISKKYCLDGQIKVKSVVWRKKG